MIVILNGWIFLISAWTIIIYLTVLCFVRVMASEKKSNQSFKESTNERSKKG